MLLPAFILFLAISVQASSKPEFHQSCSIADGSMFWGHGFHIQGKMYFMHFRGDDNETSLATDYFDLRDVNVKIINKKTIKKKATRLELDYYYQGTAVISPKSNIKKKFKIASGGQTNIREFVICHEYTYFEDENY